MVHLVNALSVARLFEATNPELGWDEVNRILFSASNAQVEHHKGETGEPEGDTPAQSLNTVMAHLAKVLGGAYAGLSTTNHSEQFYKLLDDTGLIENLTIIPTPLGGETVGSITTTYGDLAGKAYLYSLLELSSFMVIPPEGYAEGIFATGDSDYQNADGTRYSERFIADRLALLGLVNERNAEDIEVGNAVGDGDVHYTDHFNDSELPLVVFGDEATEKNDAKQVIFGSHGDDGKALLTGGDKDDRIYGLDGDDVLQGGKGNDRLEGGRGNDTYIFDLTNDGVGFDTIADTQGNSRILISGQQLKNLYAANAEASTYTDKNGNRLVRLAGQDLVLMTANGSIINLEGWNSVLTPDRTPSTAASLNGAPATITSIEPLIYSAKSNEAVNVYGLSFYGYEGAVVPFQGDDALNIGNRLINQDGQQLLIHWSQEQRALTKGIKDSEGRDIDQSWVNQREIHYDASVIAAVSSTTLLFEGSSFNDHLLGNEATVPDGDMNNYLRGHGGDDFID